MIISDLLINNSLYLIAGLFAGLLSGLMGVGGGLVVVPALLFIFSRDPIFPTNFLMQMTAATSLAIMLFTSQSAIRAHLRRGRVEWELYKRVYPGVVLGTVCGVILAKWISTQWLEIFLGLFLLVIAIKTLVDINKPLPDAHHFPSSWINILINFLIGCNSSLLGLGGGALIIPYLSYCGVAMKKIAPIAALCTMTVAIIGTLAFIVAGLKQPGLPAYTTGFVYWPAVLFVAIPSSLFARLGTKLTYALPVNQLKYLFIGLLVIIAVNLLF